VTTTPDNGSSANLDALFAAAGITVTDEGKQRARSRREAAGARWTPEQWVALRAQLGLRSAPRERPPGRILLDASAIVAFCRGTSVDVGEVNDEGAAAGLPLLCLVEGRRAIADTDLLDLLVTHGATTVVAREPDNWRESDVRPCHPALRRHAC
jgi:hypothetical protein